MLADKRSQSLVTEFFMQTLGIGALREVSPDGDRFPMWNNQLRDAMRRETELVCGEILTGDRSLMDLLRADFTYINPRLAEFYGMEFEGVWVRTCIAKDAWGGSVATAMASDAMVAIPARVNGFA